MNYYQIVIAGHEINTTYEIEGDSLKGAIESELKENGAFEWAWDSEMSVVDVYNWIKNGYGGEKVFVFRSSNPIVEILNELV